MRDRWDSALYDARHSFVWQAAAGLVEILDPKAGEKILDLGCGTGHFTGVIAEKGAEVTGLDASASMIATARQNYPKQKFVLGDARKFVAAEPYDAVFSNATLHWIHEAGEVAEHVFAALKPGGRFVLEMGGRGNIERIRTAIEAEVRSAGYQVKPVWFFPSVGQYAALLEAAGFEVASAQLFTRWTKLEHPQRGLREWIEMFAGACFEAVPSPEIGPMIDRIEESLRPHLRCDGHWWADYKRLRVVALRP